MGAWSTTILGDDFAADVYGEFLDAYNDGKELSAIRRELEMKNKNELNDPDEGPIFWLALAKAQWDCGFLDSDVLTKVGEIVNQELGLDRWREATPRDFEKKMLSRNSMQKFIHPIPNQRREKRLVMFRRFLKREIALFCIFHLGNLERLLSWLLTIHPNQWERI